MGELPFIWRPLSSAHNPEGLPDSLPFALGVEPATGTFIQCPNAEVSSSLAQAYSIGSTISGQMDAGGIGRGYADDFLRFIVSHLGPDFTGKRVLEVGCGNGFLLHQLAKRGADVLGIDPGKHETALYDVPVIRDFFPSTLIAGKFDTILGFAILEHVEDPVGFLQQLFDLLAPGGNVLLGVPDCGPYLRFGDISCLFHEHWSYFDSESLGLTLQRAGGIEVDVNPSRFGGMLYSRVAVGRKGHPAQTDGANVAPNLLANFRSRAERAMSNIEQYFEAARRLGECIGVYVPGRIVNFLSAARVHTDNCRFFDDNPLLKGTYYPGLSIPVEDRNDLIARPTDRVLIMSRSFGNSIGETLRSQLPQRVTVTGWRQLFNDET